MRISRSTARTLVWIAFGGQVAFVVSWIVAGALQPGYSQLDEGVSVLGARHAAHPWIVNAGIVILGVSIAVLGPALLRALPERPAARLAAGLFIAAGLAIVLAGVFRVDCSLSDRHCRDLWHAGSLSWQHDAHLWLDLAAQALLVLTPFAIARALWPGPVGPLALNAGITGLAIGGISFALYGTSAVPDGLVQRAGLSVIHIWVLIVGVGVLEATRRERPPGELVPLRPRDFFARSWAGEGEVVGRPFFFWRHFAQRFEARREATWLSERAWRFDDEARFGDGRTQRRHTFAEFVTDDHIRLTAGDLPDGADVWLEDGGYRVVPYRIAFPIGPLPFFVRCHDMSRVEGDGTFVNAIDVRSLGLGLPIARVTFRVRPLDAPPSASSS